MHADEKRESSRICPVEERSTIVTFMYAGDIGLGLHIFFSRQFDFPAWRGVSHAACIHYTPRLLWGMYSSDNFKHNLEEVEGKVTFRVSRSSVVSLVQPREPLPKHYGSLGNPWYSLHAADHGVHVYGRIPHKKKVSADHNLFASSEHPPSPWHGKQ